MIEATKSLDADARWLKAHGVEGSFDELRAKAFAALLAHKPLNSLIPGRADGTVGDGDSPPRHTARRTRYHQHAVRCEPGPGHQAPGRPRPGRRHRPLAR